MKRLTNQTALLPIRFKNNCSILIKNMTEGGQLKSLDNEYNVYEALFGKSLQHDSNGIPLTEELQKLKVAIDTGRQSDFDSLIMGGARKLANPQASLSFEAIGPDLETFTMPSPPRMSSRETASEMIEVYEMSLLRETSFNDIENGVGADVTRAINSINSFGSDYKGPKIEGSVTGKSLFRDNMDGFDKGPYISQFLYKPVNFGPHTITQKYPIEQGLYGITGNNWREIQNGNIPVAQQPLGPEKYIHNGRALSSVIHNDFVYQLFLYAGLILEKAGAPKNPGFIIRANEGPFVTCGGVVDWSTAVARLAHNALSAAWHQKWRNHLRLRPEALAGRVVSDSELSTSYVHPDIFTNGLNTINTIKSFNVANGGENKPYLPLVYAEGSPTHPSYPAGHAVIAGALSTYLKLVFDGSQPISVVGTVEHSIDGSSLVEYVGDTSEMTVNTELNKLASNVARGRDVAGVHYLSDGHEGILLGEKIAIAFFKENIHQYHASCREFRLKKFDGSEIIVKRDF